MAGQFDRITTERLLLRRWRNSDRVPFAALNGDPATLVYFPAALSRAESNAVIDRTEARFQSHGYGLRALEVRETGRQPVSSRLAAASISGSLTSTRLAASPSGTKLSAAVTRAIRPR